MGCERAGGWLIDVTKPPRGHLGETSRVSRQSSELDAASGVN